MFLPLPTDILVWLLIGAAAGFSWYCAKRPHLAAPWARVFRSRAAVGSAVFLAAYLLIGFLDSMHFRPALPSKEGQPVAYSTQAVLPGGDLRAVASFRPTSPRPSWAAGLDSGATLIVRIAPSGEFKKRLLARPLDKCIVEYRYAKGSGTTGIPFCPSPLSTDWDGGTGVASVDVEVSEGKAARYRVTVVDDQGVTRFSRSIGYVPVPATKGAADSLAAIRAMIIKDSPPDAVAAMPNPKPYPNFPPIRRVILGRDYSVWLEERILGPGHRWLVLDPKGVTVGVVTVPSEITLRAAEFGTIWGTITDADDLQGVVRYRVGR